MINAIQSSQQLSAEYSAGINYEQIWRDWSASGINTGHYEAAF